MCPTPEKCATVFRHNGRYTFLCFHCNHNFDNFDTIVTHIEATHFADDNSIDDKNNTLIDIKVESSLFESFNDDYHSDEEELSTFGTDKKFNLNISTDIKEQKETYGGGFAADVKIPFHFNNAAVQNCSICQKVFTEYSALSLHILNEHGCGGSIKKPYKCETCKSLFGNTNDFLNHLSLKHNVNVNGLLTKMFCEICNKDFTDKKRLTSHLHYHVKNDLYACKKCPARYKLLKPYRAHLLQHNSGKKVITYICDICSKTFIKKSNMKQHIEYVHLSMDRRVCEICAQTFKYDKSYKEHMRKHTGEKPYKCEHEQCDKAFRSLKLLKSHSSLQHSKQLYVCDCCAKTYKCETYLRRHILDEHSGRLFFCNLCDYQINQKSQLLKHQQTCKERSVYPCKLCTRICKTQILLNLHITRKHVPKPSYECLACHRTFKSIGPLNTHMNQMHSTDMHVCDQCGKSFKCNRYLRNHQEVMHAVAPKLYKCTLCDLTVKRKTSLNKHYENIHSNLPNQYACDKCPQTFKHKPTYIHHIRMHTGEKNYQCTQCGKMYYTNCILSKHIREAHPTGIHSCDKCGKEFKSRGRLKVHLNTHSTEQPHECPICFKKFKTRKYMRDHKIIHSDVKRYKCNYCDMRFLLLSGQRRHERSRHGFLGPVSTPTNISNFNVI